MELPQTFTNGITVSAVAQSAVWANATQSAITLQVTFDHLGGSVPFTAIGTDTEPHGVALYQSAVAGDFGAIAPYVQTAEEITAAFKMTRADAVAAITVTTTAGNTFNGDEDSQNRMGRSIVALSDSDTITWVLADNSTIQATRAELQEALKLSGEAQTGLWIQPTTTATS